MTEPLESPNWPPMETRSAEEIIDWAWTTFGHEAAASSSFQTQSVPLLHMIGEICPDLPVLFLDTGFHFPETIAFRDRLVKQFGLNLKNLRCEIGHDAFLRCYGTLYRQDPEQCCFLNKVQPLASALGHYKAWITGIRRDQTATRSATRVLEQRPDGLLKIAPLASWADIDVRKYAIANDLPRHPLADFGYNSIGCAPCTVPSKGRGDRSGRWSGISKTECGIHEGYWESVRQSRKSS